MDPKASGRDVRTSQEGLGASKRGPRASQGGCLDGQMDNGLTNGQTEFLPILQDYQGRCPKNRKRNLSGNKGEEKGKLRARPYSLPLNDNYSPLKRSVSP